LLPIIFAGFQHINKNYEEKEGHNSVSEKEF